MLDVFTQSRWIADSLSLGFGPRSSGWPSLAPVGRVGRSLRRITLPGWTLPEARPKVGLATTWPRGKSDPEDSSKMAGPFETLEAALEEANRALTAIGNGDPSVYLGLFADREEITLGNPFGPFGCGREAVAKNLANAATKYRNGEMLGVERLATYASGDMACFVEVEHFRAEMVGTGGTSEARVRVTTVYERRDGGWNLVHRHADPITTPRGTESLLTT